MRVKALNAIKTAKGSLSDYERGVLNTLASLVPYLMDDLINPAFENDLTI